jgi:hypothetical protein
MDRKMRELLGLVRPPPPGLGDLRRRQCVFRDLLFGRNGSPPTPLKGLADFLGEEGFRLLYSGGSVVAAGRLRYR